MFERSEGQSFRFSISQDSVLCNICFRCPCSAYSCHSWLPLSFRSKSQNLWQQSLNYQPELRLILGTNINKVIPQPLLCSPWYLHSTLLWGQQYLTRLLLEPHFESSTFSYSYGLELLSFYFELWHITSIKTALPSCPKVAAAAAAATAAAQSYGVAVLVGWNGFVQCGRFWGPCFCVFDLVLLGFAVQCNALMWKCSMRRLVLLSISVFVITVFSFVKTGSAKWLHASASNLPPSIRFRSYLGLQTPFPTFLFSSCFPFSSLFPSIKISTGYAAREAASGARWDQAAGWVDIQEASSGFIGLSFRSGGLGLRVYCQGLLIC